MTSRSRWTGYACAVVAAAMGTLVGFAIEARFDIVNIAMVYLLGVVIVALQFSLGPAVLAAILSVGAFDYLFVPPRGTFTVDDLQYLLTFAIVLAVALVIARLVRGIRREAEARAALELGAETERIRSTLLASISHDLRTPLAVMTGASSSLAEQGERMSPAARHELARSVYTQAQEMAEHVDKILQMTRLETGALKLDRDWASLAEIVASVRARLRERLVGHPVIVDIPDDLPLVWVDAVLIEQALGNLLENCARHTPAGTAVRVRARHEVTRSVITVEDYGEGLPDADLERVFAKFHHSTQPDRGTDLGLGLAICRAIVVLHEGEAWAERVAGGGTAFHFSLPGVAPPAVPRESPPGAA